MNIMDENQKFENLARKVKIKRWLWTIGLIVILVPLVMIGFDKITGHLVRQQSNQLFKKMDMRSTIMAPNIQTSDRLLADDNNQHGKIISHRYKEIDGYRIPWSSVEGRYDLFTNAIALSNVVDSHSQTQKSHKIKVLDYDRTTQTKIPLFYNNQYQAHLKADSLVKPQELPRVAQMSNYVAEVALTFKQPLTYQAIQQKLPQNLHANWYWIGTNKHNSLEVANNNYLGIQAYNNRISNHDYQDFRKLLAQAQTLGLTETFTLNNDQPYKPAQYAAYYAKKYPDLKKARFYGVIVTGQSENFKQLENADWISASSTGATIERVPYIKPEY
ncbi:anti-sigma factor [Bombilactobacillus bombi]|uniref:Anti-sigma factor n=2 Tax=Bombilactobacillus bombi TaxID=1303590 RepID=A0A3R6YIE3_9LACO|nr:anti-sigma factor [Bombilactobacillus bombi]